MLEAFKAVPHLSIRCAARQLSVSRCFVWRVLRRRMYPFKAKLLHELKPDDYARRGQFCEDDLVQIQANPSHLQFPLFMDESFFFFISTFASTSRTAGCRLSRTRTGRPNMLFSRRQLWCGAAYGEKVSSARSFWTRR